MINLLKTYPKTAMLVCKKVQNDFVQSYMERNPNASEEELKGAAEFIKNEEVAILVGKQPRSLFDFFDNHFVFISIIYNNINKWELRINDKSKKGKYYSTRREAEYDAVEQSFKILEERLNKDDDDAGVSEANTSGGGE